MKMIYKLAVLPLLAVFLASAGCGETKTTDAQSEGNLKIGGGNAKKAGERPAPPAPPPIAPIK